MLAACKGKPSPPAGGIPADLQIPVIIDGEPSVTIDAAMLVSHKPDFELAERKAWRLASLIGAPFSRPDATLEVEAHDGVKTQFPHPGQPAEGREPVLALNRRGDVGVALMK